MPPSPSTPLFVGSSTAVAQGESSSPAALLFAFHESRLATHKSRYPFPELITYD
jgi:hypothetical protein